MPQCGSLVNKAEQVNLNLRDHIRRRTLTTLNKRDHMPCLQRRAELAPTASHAYACLQATPQAALPQANSTLALESAAAACAAAPTQAQHGSHDGACRPAEAPSRHCSRAEAAIPADGSGDRGTPPAPAPALALQLSLPRKALAAAPGVRLSVRQLVSAVAVSASLTSSCAVRFQC